MSKLTTQFHDKVLADTNAFLGRFYEPLGRKEWMPGAVLATLLVVSSWSYFIWNGSINTIWPMFGIANQLLAAVALAVGTTIIINMDKARYAWVTGGRCVERPRQLLADGNRAQPETSLPGLPR